MHASGERGTGNGREPGAGSREPGAGSREPGAGSREPEWYTRFRATLTITLTDQLFAQLREQAVESAETPEAVAARIVAERLAIPHSSPEVRAIIARQLRDYQWAFDRLAE